MSTVPTIQRMILVPRWAIAVRIPAVTLRSWVRTSVSSALNRAAVTLVALLGELPRGVGYDFSLVAVDAPAVNSWATENVSSMA